MRRIRVKFRDSTLFVIEEDTIYFGKEKNEMLNAILKYYLNIGNCFESISDIEIKKEKYTSSEEIVFFKEDKFNSEIIKRIKKEKPEYYSKIFLLFEDYCKKPRYEREIIVNHSLYLELQQAINDKIFKSVSVKKNDEIVRIEAIILGILQTKEYDINYVAYTEDGEKIQSEKLSNLKLEKIWTKGKDIDLGKIKKEYEIISKSFNVAKLNLNDQLNIKLSKKGIKTLSLSKANRPSLMEENDSYFKFYSNLDLAIEYFARFYEQIEDIKEENIRLELLNNYEKTLKLYLEEMGEKYDL